MSLIEKTIAEYGTDFANIFVFPSSIASRLWFGKSLQITKLSTIPAENYISWDTFKTKCLISESGNLLPVNNKIRNIFAEYICNKNSEAAQKSSSIFYSIIPQEYAEVSTIFSKWITGILPQLDHFEKRYTDNKSILKEDKEFYDYILLKKYYNEFLQKNKLFEPSWIASAFYSYQKNYIIIYPELIEDFSEHAELLNAQKEISLLNCPAFNSKTHINVFENSRSELRNAVLQIEQLLLQGIPADEIAVNIPDIENYTPYIKREFYLRGIPAEFRSGFKLGTEQSGKIFSLIYDCVQNNFSFEFIKPIILNPHIPWKDKEGAEALIVYGVKNNCAVSWKDKKEDIKYKNIWIESFKINFERNEEDFIQKEKAKTWFYNFYYAVINLCSAKTFSDLQKYYFLFREKCLNPDEFSQRDNAILGRCISCLQELSLLEKTFFEYMPLDRFKFFINRLEEEIYVPQNTGCAVSIFPYRVASGTPFSYQFILDCSQKNTNVIYNKLSFLRKDKREMLGISEINASKDFFSAYADCPNCSFSFAKQNFTDFLIINSLFELTEENGFEKTNHLCQGLDIQDSFLQEYNFVATDCPEKKLNSIYRMQYIGAEAYSNLKEKKSVSYLKNKLENKCSELNNFIYKNKYINGNLKLSQKDLKIFTECPSSWFLKNILSVFTENYDAHIFDAKDIGDLCHNVLEKLYKYIKETDYVFKADNILKYKKIASEYFDGAAKHSPNFKGALAAPFIESLKKQVLAAADFVLTSDAELLDGYVPEWIEEWIEIQRNGILYCGRIDRASFPQDERSGVIIDYKTKGMPPFNSYGDKNDLDIELSDFQIPMYIFLAEEKLNERFKNTGHSIKADIEHAWFLSFVEKKINKVVNNDEVINGGNSKNKRTREDFQKVMDIFILYAEKFKHLVEEQDFTKPASVNFAKCLLCPFKNVCRTTFSMNT